MASHCTYVYSDPKTGTPVYVGEGRIDRPFDHLKNTHCTRLRRLIDKRTREGFNVTPRVIPAESKSDAQEMEMLLIAMFGREDLKTGSLFNRAPGGGGRGEWTDEQRAAKSKSQTAEWLKPGRKEDHSEKVRTSLANMSDDARRSWSEKLSKAKIAAEANRTPEQKAITSAKISQARIKISANQTAEVKAGIYRKTAASLCRKCTVDGIKIFDSRKALIAELGHGIAGKNHPNFRYV